MAYKILSILFTFFTLQAFAFSPMQMYRAEQRQISHFRVLQKPVVINPPIHNFRGVVSDGSLPARYYHFKNAGIGLLATGSALTVAGVTFIGIAPYAISFTAYFGPGIAVLCGSVLFTIPGAVLLAEAIKIKRKNIALYPSITPTDLAMIKPAPLITGVTLSIKF